MFPLLSAQTSLCRQILTKNQLSKFLYNLSSENNISARWASTSPDEETKPFRKMPGLGLFRTLAHTRRHTESSGNMHAMWGPLFDRFGPIFRLKYPGRSLVAVMEPEDIKRVYKVTENDPRRPETHGALMKVRSKNEEIFHKGKSTGLILEVGEEWKRIRSLTQAPMLKPKAVSLYLPQMDLVSREFISYLKKSEKDGLIKPESFYEDLRKWASENIALVILNRKMGCFETEKPLDPYSKKFLEYSSAFFDVFLVIESAVPLYKYFKTKQFRQYETTHNNLLTLAIEGIEEAIQAIESSQAAGGSSKNPTILEMFMNTKGMKRSDLITMVGDLFIGGVDNVTVTLIFTLYQLAKNPKNQRKLQEEIDSVLKDSDAITVQQIDQITYLDKIFKEAMRLNNVSTGSARVLVRNEAIRGYMIPKGTSIVMMNNVTHKREEYFTKPEEFIPERWNRDRPHGEIHPYSSIPFSTGTRMCIGKRIAMQEMSLLIIRILQDYTIGLDPPSTEMNLKSDLLLRPAEDLPFVFRKRDF